VKEEEIRRGKTSRGDEMKNIPGRNFTAEATPVHGLEVLYQCFRHRFPECQSLIRQRKVRVQVGLINFNNESSRRR
jgi:hypothetical protein